MNETRLYNKYGQLVSPKDLTEEQLYEENVRFLMEEKSRVSLAVASSLFVGDYFEFGSAGLSTFRNMLTAYHLYNLDKLGRDARFYAFDLFGKDEVSTALAKNHRTEFDAYFEDLFLAGDQLPYHLDLIEEHGLYQERCQLVQGMFEDTLNDEFKSDYLGAGRKIGFAFIDCNITSSYEVVFEFLCETISERSFIYMDEYYQNQHVPALYSKFVGTVQETLDIDSVFVRSAGGVGALFRFVDRI